MAGKFDLRSGETVLQEVSGDYWEKSFLCFYGQKTGKYCFSSERILFRGGFATELDIPYANIESVSTCMVGAFIPFLPTGIKVVTKDRAIYKLSVLGRKKIVDLINSARS